MSGTDDDDEVLGLLDDLRRIATEHGVRIEIESDEGISLAVTPSSGPRAPAPAGRGAERAAPEDATQRVHATAVGIFSAAKEWSAGERVSAGTLLGAIQSLGHMADVVAPADGEIREVLVAAGAPVEYGQPLFAIAIKVR